MTRLHCVLLVLGGALLLMASDVHAQAPPKHEFRGAWIATAYNLDWPPSPTASPSAQKADLRRMLDSLKAVGINAVVFQVRSEGDAMYDSALEPWAYELTGEQGRAPDLFYDPLQFVLDEAHARGMELHAWFNPFRAVSNGASYEQDSTHVAVEHPEWLLEFEDGLRVLDPGLPEVRDYITQVVLDVVRRYDVDGVHFDDYFYPYPPNEMDQEGNRTKDRDTFEAHPRGFDDIENWRRDNINTFMAQVHDSIQATKPHVTFGVSPFGIWKAGVPNGIAGLSAYHTIYADAVAWLEDQSIDYSTPQLYWGFGDGQDYATLAPWWAARANENERHLYPGLAAYKAASSKSSLRAFQARAAARYGARNYGSRVVPRQVRFNRRRGAIQGSLFFRAEHLTRTSAQGLTDSLRQGLYRRPALPPSLPWEATDPPPPPQALTVERTGPEDKGVRLEWATPGADLSGAERYAVYRVRADASPDFANETQTAEHLVAVTGTPTVRDRPVRAEAPYHYAVTAVGPNAGESPPSGSVAAEGRVSQAAEAFAVRGPNPNPFTGTATLDLDLAASADVTVTVYDVLGRRVQQVRTSMPPGPAQSLRLDGAPFASGVYFYRVRVTTDDGSQAIGTGRMVKMQ